MKHFTIGAGLALAALLAGCDKDNNNGYDYEPAAESVVFTAAGDKATATAKMDAFRTKLGDPLNTTPDQTAGRREVNWDGVPPGFTNNNNFPVDFFNNTDAGGPAGRKRGLLYVSNGAPLRIDSTSFTSLDASYESQFPPFSGQRQIISAGSVTTQAVFRVAGTNSPAFVKGFGVMFCDVDNPGSTTIEFFNAQKSLGVFKASAAAGNGNFSFLGVFFPGEKITSVKIISGNAPLEAGVKDITGGGTKDLVTMDDFIYSEPVAN